MKRILLTGASGTVGREVLKQLCASDEDYDIRLIDIKSRTTKSFYRKYRKKVSIIYGDISNKKDVQIVCSNLDAIIHLAAIIPPLADKYRELADKVNINGTRNLVEAATELSPGAFFLYSSSISVYGDRLADPLIKVDDPLLPSDRDHYARTKIEAERIIMKSRLNWTIFRLTAIMGVDNHQPSALMFHMPLKSHLEIATPSDTGRAFVNALKFTDLLKGRIFNLSGGEKCRILYRDLLSKSFEIFGLGESSFREGSFAEKNFHCGYYQDGDYLNEILDFRRETLEDYFANLKKNISPTRKQSTKIFRRIIKHNLQKQSEPLVAIRNNNPDELNHYF